MPVLQEPLNLGDLLKYEAPNLYSRDLITVAAGQNLRLGAVLGQEAATGRYKAVDPVATDGTEQAVAVLAQDADASLIERSNALAITRHAIVSLATLVWPEAMTAAQRNAALIQLQSRGVVARRAA